MTTVTNKRKDSAAVMKPADNGHLDEMVMSMVETANDKSPSVRKSVESSLVNVGKSHCNLVVSYCNLYLVKNPKMPQVHKSILLNVMLKVLKDNVDNISEDVVRDVIKQSFAEMIQNKEIGYEDQTNLSSDIVVLLGSRFCHEVMTELLEKFQPNTVPHFFVVQTLSNLSLVNVYGMVPSYMKACLGACLPMLLMTKSDNMKFIFTKMLSSFSEAIVDYMANIESAPDQNVKKEFFSTEVWTAWEHLFDNWLSNKDLKVKGQVVECLGRMSNILASTKLNECLQKFIPAVCSILKKQHYCQLVTEGLHHMLEAAVATDCMAVDPYLDNILNSLFLQSQWPINLTSTTSVKNHNQSLRCFSLLGESLRDKEKQLLSGLKMIINDPSNKVRRSLAETLVKISHHGYLELEGGKSFVEFVLKQCLLNDESVTGSTQKKQQQQQAVDQNFVTNNMLRMFCENVLHLLATTVQNTNNALWPYLFEFLIQSNYTNACGVVCKTISSLANKKLENGDPDYYIDFDREVSVPKPEAIFVRLFVLLGHPKHGYKRGVYVLQALISLSKLFHPCLEDLWKKSFSNMAKILEDDDSDDKKWDQTKWEAALINILRATIDEIKRESWTSRCGREMLQQISLYSSSPLEKAFLFKCIGIAISKIPVKKNIFIVPVLEKKGGSIRGSEKDRDLSMAEDNQNMMNKEFVCTCIDALFNNTNHEIADEREACAQAIGLASSPSLSLPLPSSTSSPLSSPPSKSPPPAAPTPSPTTSPSMPPPPPTPPSSNVDVIFEKLESILRSKKTSSFITFIKVLVVEAVGEFDEKFKSTICLCYGYIALYVPPQMLQSCLDFYILAHINHYNVSNIKDPALKVSIIRSIELVCRSIHSKNSSHAIKGLILNSRDVMLNGIKNLMKQESQTSLPNDFRTQITTTCSALVFVTFLIWLNKLDPPLKSSDVHEIFSIFASRIITLPPDLPPSSSSSSSSPSPSSSPSISSEEQTTYQSLLQKCNVALVKLATVFVERDPSPGVFSAIFQILQPLLISAQEFERLRALTMLYNVVVIYLKKINNSLVNKIGNLGQVVGFIVPRCADQSVQVRMIAANCLHKLLSVGLRYEGRSADFRDENVDKMETIKQHLCDNNVLNNPDAMLYYVNQLAEVLNFRVGFDHLLLYIETLISSLLDLQPQSSSAVSIILACCIKSRGMELQGVVDKIYHTLHNTLPFITHPQTRTGALRVIRALTSHHLVKVITLLLDETYPLVGMTSEIWQDLGHDPQLSLSLVDNLFETLSRSTPYEEVVEVRGRNKSYRRATVLPLAAILALTDIMKAPESNFVVMQNYGKLIVLLMSYVASMCETSLPKIDKKKSSQNKSQRVSPGSSSTSPTTISVQALRQLVTASQQQRFIEQLENEKVWEILLMDKQERLLEGFTIFARCLADHDPMMISKLAGNLNSLLSSAYTMQRIMVAVIFAEFINKRCGEDSGAVDVLVGSLLNRLADNDSVVRRMCIRGLGNLASNGKPVVQKHSASILTALMAGTDDKDDVDDVIALEAMTSLLKLVSMLSLSNVNDVVIKMALRIRPWFDKDNADIRETSLKLFGDLSTFALKENKEQFVEQVHSNIVSILLHLNDEEPRVLQASKKCLRKLGTLLDAAEINEMFQKHLIDDAALKYSLFMNDLSKLIVRNLPDKVAYYSMGLLTYFKCHNNRLRSNAAIFIGCLVGNYSKIEAGNSKKVGGAECVENGNVDRAVDGVAGVDGVCTDDTNVTSVINKDQVCRALMLLLKDEDAEVRSSAVEAISCLFAAF
ncbi:hypothetical protein HELRODRAFT_189222 [Helobdella robusta]|uniref:Maestro heat-like repeat-containing protein family member 1 n=1 Tax=Helobdella robusta TaxID=6412 RepID=T1FQT6_HELRO|nr:hypothetical protein HELRODRAFT_189222 [Helobdella robusta]ESN96385.1 hypothetical protein HELRODRAFT_189222 [Helobdella robusta]